MNFQKGTHRGIFAVKSHALFTLDVCPTRLFISAGIFYGILYHFPRLWVQDSAWGHTPILTVFVDYQIPFTQLS